MPVDCIWLATEFASMPAEFTQNMENSMEPTTIRPVYMKSLAMSAGGITASEENPIEDTIANQPTPPRMPNTTANFQALFFVK